jgi:hypothetical protein
MTEKAIFNDESAKGIWIDHFFKEYIPGVSTDCVDEAAKKMVAEFLTKPELHNAVGVWNFCKELLDWGAYGALFSPFEMTALDLERSYDPPVGGYNYADGSLDQAPWRLEEPFKRDPDATYIDLRKIDVNQQEADAIEETASWTADDKLQEIYDLEEDGAIEQVFDIVDTMMWGSRWALLDEMLDKFDLSKATTQTAFTFYTCLHMVNEKLKNRDAFKKKLFEVFAIEKGEDYAKDLFE